MPRNAQRLKGRSRMIVILCTSLVLTACGGGDSESVFETPATPANATVPIDSPVALAASVLPPGGRVEVASLPPAETATFESPVVGAWDRTRSQLREVVTPDVPPGTASVGDGSVGTIGTASAERSPDSTKSLAIDDAAPSTAVLVAASTNVTSSSSPSAQTLVRHVRTIYVDAQAGRAGNGSAATPYRTIGAAMQTLTAGDDVVIAAGTYREGVTVPALAPHPASTRIRAAVDRTVTIKGSEEIAGWTALSPAVYAVGWSGDEPQQVFRAGLPLKQIGGTVFGGFPVRPTADVSGSTSDIWPTRVNGGVAELVADSFTYDADSRRLLIKVSTPLGSAEKLEVSTRQHVLQAESANSLTVEGIDFVHSNTSRSRRWGAIKVVGKSITLRNLVVRDMDATCVQIIGEDNALLDSTIERCGQTGIAGHGRRLTIANNQVLSNNTRGFNKWWEAGGMKLIGNTGLHDSVIRNNVVAYNAGDGIWLDTNNTNILIEGNTAAYNAGFGIHYETSRTGTIRGNRAYGNTMRGIYLSESSSTLVEGNAVFGNAMEGIGVIDGDRSARDPALKPFDNRVINNTIAWNDFERNWIQLVLPGDGFRSSSDSNAFKSERLSPRMSMGFMSPTNAPYERLELWQARKRVDLASTTQTVPMPADLKAALAARRLLTTGQLPRTLALPGTH